MQKWEYLTGYCFYELVNKAQRRAVEKSKLDPRVNWGDADGRVLLLWNGEYRSPLGWWLDDRGKEGWELVGMSPLFRPQAAWADFSVVLKRPLLEGGGESVMSEQPEGALRHRGAE